MKIISGTLKGRNFYMLAGIRPTQDKIRKALFDLIGHHLRGITFLDLFAGSGAVGLEAVSLGASRVVFVEREERCARVIRENIETLSLTFHEKGSASLSVVPQDAFKTVKEFHQKGEKFNFIFIDPPYERQLGKKTLKTLSAYDILHPNCSIIIQHDKREILPETEGRILRVKERKYGSTVLSFYRSA